MLSEISAKVQRGPNECLCCVLSRYLRWPRRVLLSVFVVCCQRYLRRSRGVILSVLSFRDIADGPGDCCRVCFCLFSFRDLRVELEGS